MNDLKQEPKQREERDTENNLNLKTDQYYKKLALVKNKIQFLNLLFRYFFLIES